MPRHARTCLIVALLPLALAACDKVQTAGEMLRAEGGEEVPLEVLDSNQIPREWGRLASVTVDPGSDYGFLLWFEDDAGDIRIIGFDREEHRLWKTGRIIRRS